MKTNRELTRKEAARIEEAMDILDRADSYWHSSHEPRDIYTKSVGEITEHISEY